MKYNFKCAFYNFYLEFITVLISVGKEADSIYFLFFCLFIFLGIPLPVIGSLREEPILNGISSKSIQKYFTASLAQTFLY